MPYFKVIDIPPDGRESLNLDAFSVFFKKAQFLYLLKIGETCVEGVQFMDRLEEKCGASLEFPDYGRTLFSGGVGASKRVIKK